MKTIFYDDTDDDSGRWDTDLPSPPHLGAIVFLPGKRLGKVIDVRWVLDEDEHYVEVTVDLI